MDSTFDALDAKEFDQPEAFSDIAHQFILMYERAKDSKTGLLYHAYDAERRQRWADPVTGCSPHFWGRAMGWYFMAITESLSCFPKGHPSIPRLLEILRAVADAVVRYQDKESGLWYQVLDCGGRDGNYWEASASAMFTFALCRAAELGYLDARYRQAAERGFAGIIAHLTQVCDDGTMDLNQVCEVAGLGGQPYRDGSYDYYVHESIKTNDFKGAGPFMLAALWLDR